MDSYIGTDNCNDYRIGNDTIKKLYKGDTLIWEKSVVPPTPTGSGYTQVWLPLSSITNYQAFNAIAWGTGYTTNGSDRWVSEIPYVVSDSMGWSEGNSQDTGWFASHRWNNFVYSLSFKHDYTGVTDFNWDCPDIEYGVSVKDNGRDNLGETTIQVCGQTEHVYMTEFHDWTYWKPCFGAYSGASSMYGGKVFVRVQLPTQLWYTTTDEHTYYGYSYILPKLLYKGYGVDGGILEVVSGCPVGLDSQFYPSPDYGNLKTIILPIGTSSSNIKKDMFWHNTGLTSIVFPPTVTELPNDAFHWCTSLSEFHWGYSVFPNLGNRNGGVPDSGTIYVPTGCDMTNLAYSRHFSTWNVVYT